jgi:hypothetical protein
MSAHGITIATLYLGAVAVWQLGASKVKYGTPFAFAFLIPLALMVYAIITYPGPRSIHWLQLLNFVAIFWSAFIGTMAITGGWL